MTQLTQRAFLRDLYNSGITNRRELSEKLAEAIQDGRVPYTRRSMHIRPYATSVVTDGFVKGWLLPTHV